MTIDIVVPTLGRASLTALLQTLATSAPPLAPIVLVDDRRRPAGPLLPTGPPAALAERVTVVRGRAAGPAAARNTGWRRSTAQWVAFLDDDVVPAADWLEALRADLADQPRGVGGSQGRIVVPLSPDRQPTDWERNVRGLETARWATADMAYRRAALQAVGGFDERFPRAYREDADLALRVQDAGWHIVRGRRVVRHPARPAGRWISVRRQAGNADDVLMRVRHGPSWRDHAGIAPGCRGRHLLITAAGLLALGALTLGRRRTAAAAATLWAGETARFAWSRIAPGPRTRDELATMAVTSLAIPPTATWYWLRGWAAVAAQVGACPSPVRRPRAVLFDRDGALVVDVPCKGDPARVVPVPGARAALDRLRSAGVRVAVVSNQDADVEAARAAGARGVLVPNVVTRREEIDAAPEVVSDLAAAVDLLLESRP